MQICEHAPANSVSSDPKAKKNADVPILATTAHTAKQPPKTGRWTKRPLTTVVFKCIEV